MTNNIKYLDQKGLKTFHDATGWVTIEIPVNGKFVVYDESPIKFINGGLMDIGNMPNQGISAGDVKRFAKGTLIVNKANSEIKLEIFTRHYNQLIQHEFKTDKLTLPGTTSQVVLGDGSLKGLDNLVVGYANDANNSESAKNANKIYTNDLESNVIITQEGTPLFLSGFTNNSNDYKDLIGFNNTYVSVTESGEKLVTRELKVNDYIELQAGKILFNSGDEADLYPYDEEYAVLGDGSLKGLDDLVVGNSKNVYIKNIQGHSETSSVYLTGSKTLGDSYCELFNSRNIYISCHFNENGAIASESLITPGLEVGQQGLSFIAGSLTIKDSFGNYEYDEDDILLANGQPIAKSDLINELLGILLSNGNEDIIATSDDIEEIFNITNNNTNTTT